MSDQEGKMLLGIKFSVPSRGELGKNRIWRIYRNVDQGHSDTEYFEHLEILGIPTWTGEAAYRIGYSLLCEGYLTEDYCPVNGYRFGVIHSGDYKQQYNEKLEKL